MESGLAVLGGRDGEVPRLSACLGRLMAVGRRICRPTPVVGSFPRLIGTFKVDFFKVVVILVLMTRDESSSSDHCSLSPSVRVVVCSEERLLFPLADEDEGDEGRFRFRTG